MEDKISSNLNVNEMSCLSDDSLMLSKALCDAFVSANENRASLSLDHDNRGMTGLKVSEDELVVTSPCGIKRVLETPVQLHPELRMPSLHPYDGPLCKKVMRKVQTVLNPQQVPLLPEFPILEEPEVALVILPKPSSTASSIVSSAAYGSVSCKMAQQVIGQITFEEPCDSENPQRPRIVQCQTPIRSPMRVLNQDFPSYPDLPRRIKLKMRTSLLEPNKATTQATDYALDTLAQMFSNESLFLPL